MANNQFVKTVVDILDSYNSIYSFLSGGKAKNYIEYIKLKKTDEITLIQPKIFPDFLEHVLDFSPKLDYTPELKSGKSGRPDFTPNDELLHNFVFEIKGTDATRESLMSEYHRKTKGYVYSKKSLQYAIITNMVDLIVVNKKYDKIEDDCSFSFADLYISFKNNSRLKTRNENIIRFLKFVEKFRKKPLTTEKKIDFLAKAKPYKPLSYTDLEGRYKQVEKITDSVRKIVEWFVDDAKNVQGSFEILTTLRNLPERKLSIAREIYQICNEISNKYQPPSIDKITSEHLEELLETQTGIEHDAVNIYFYRTGYFMMSRIMLIRAWEDSRFIESKYQTLYDGGFAKWYFETFDKKISQVLKQSFSFAKDKYEWLFKDDTNYSWYAPTDKVLVDVLYEFARYNLSVLNRDILGTVYEDYLEIQDKKNKGQYYTPYPIVELIWDKINYFLEKDFYRYEKGKRVPKKVYDPALGSGGFLVEASRRLRSGTYHGSDIKKLDEIKNAVINGLFGSEISAFSYYISEVNLLIQLTPVIKQIVEKDEKRRDLEGKFTLSIIRQDSLALHNRINPSREKGEEIESNHEEIFKPVGEKLRIRNFIREYNNFDYVVANPPYIGEADHKELFRNTIKNYPYWKQYYQGKMDYLYFFIILGIQKLRYGGKLGFITSSYWLTADGASKLRKYILNNTKIVEIINFHEIKLFEHAPGQHNIIFILEKCKSEELRKENKIKLVEVKKKFDGETVYEKIRNLCVHIRQYSKKPPYDDDHISVYWSPVIQDHLTEKPWYIFHSESEEDLLKQIEGKGVKLETICNVNQGVVTRAHKVTKGILEDYIPETKVKEFRIKKGDGIFVLSKEELQNMHLKEKELEIIKPFYKNSNIARYSITDKPEKEFLIYTMQNTKINNYPSIRDHLKKFRLALEEKRDSYNENYPWFKLHREREQKIFENEKIICPYRSTMNTFGYATESFYGSTDMYFITSKKEQRIDNKRYDLKYILGVLNSNVMKLWTHHKTKPKGKMRELFYSPLTQFPIKPINFDDADEIVKYKNIIKSVEKMILLKKDLLKFDCLFSPILSKIHEDDETPEIMNEHMVIDFLEDDEIINLPYSDLVSYDDISPDFILKNIGKINSTITGSKFKQSLTISGKNKENVLLKGEKNLLQYLEKALTQFYGETWSKIEEKLLVPNNITAYKSKTESIKNEIETKREEIKNLQESIDSLVCELYNLDKNAVEDTVLNLS
jgi:type I restriction-modification system DNA methylase subunit